jgi:hypothetical protein
MFSPNQWNALAQIPKALLRIAAALEAIVESLAKKDDVVVKGGK